MLDYSNITPRTYIILDGEPYEVLDSHIFRKQQRKPVNQTKLKNLVTGKVVERSFHQSEKVERADIERAPFIYIYSRRGECWLHEKDNPKNRISIPDDTAGPGRVYLKEGMEIEALIFNEEIIGITVPIKVELEVTEAPPSVKGNTAQGADKMVTLETGATVTTPIFINEGDIIRVNTQTGEYAERVEKA